MGTKTLSLSELVSNGNERAFHTLPSYNTRVLLPDVTLCHTQDISFSGGYYLTKPH